MLEAKWSEIDHIETTRNAATLRLGDEVMAIHHFAIQDQNEFLAFLQLIENHFCRLRFFELGNICAGQLEIRKVRHHRQLRDNHAVVDHLIARLRIDKASDVGLHIFRKALDRHIFDIRGKLLHPSSVPSVPSVSSVSSVVNLLRKRLQPLTRQPSRRAKATHSREQLRALAAAITLAVDVAVVFREGTNADHAESASTRADECALACADAATSQEARQRTRATGTQDIRIAAIQVLIAELLHEAIPRHATRERDARLVGLKLIEISHAVQEGREILAILFVALRFDLGSDFVGKRKRSFLFFTFLGFCGRLGSRLVGA